MTALTLYLSSAASATLSTANKLYSILGTPTGTSNNTQLGTLTGWGEIWAQGTTNVWPAGGSSPAPSGHGFLFDVTTLEGNDLLAGAYSGSLQFSTTGVGAVTITADLHCAVYKRSSGGVYTLIGDMVLSAQSVSTTAANFSFSMTTGSNTSFVTGDKLYIHLPANV